MKCFFSIFSVFVFLYRNPNAEGLAHWPQYDVTNKKYMELGLHPKVARDYKPKQMSLWNNTVMDLAQSSEPVSSKM